MKKILAIAIASAFAAPAFAATSNVDIYGAIGLSFDYVDGGSCTAGVDCIVTPGFAADSSESRARVSNSNSYIGFKGAEDLGGGLSAVWQIEQAIAPDAGGGTWATGRNTFAGLSSKTLGTVTLGSQDTPYKTSTGKLDVFTTHYIADYRSLFGQPTNGSVRAANSVLYTSPSLGGLTLRGMGAAQQENGSTRDPRLYSLSGVYENGPLYAALAYESTRYATGSAAMIASAGGNSYATDAASTAETDQKKWRAGVGYSFGNTKLGVGYERSNWDSDALTGTIDGGQTSVSTSRNAWYVGAAHAIGNTTLKAAYTKAGDLKGASNTGATQISLGATYALSKRTEVFGLYTQVKNDSDAAYSLGGGATGTPETLAAAYGQDPRGISLGMVHKF